MEVASHTGFMLQTMLFMVNHPWNNSLYRAIHNVPNTNIDKGSRCYGIYGCFSFDYPWVSERRPLVYPRSPEELGVRFSVYNKHAQNSPKYVDLDDPDGIPQLGIESEGMLYVIAHDHIAAGGEPWVHRLVRALLQNDTSGTASVLTIDWRRTSPLGNLQHVSDSRLVGAITAHMIHMIYTETGMQNLDKIHLLGHSLGAHLCGYVGYYLQKDFGLRLGRITGMDPVVEMFADTDPMIRLDNSDAKFVDVIHTHAIWYQSIGHVDFYPTGGHPHLGCDESTHTTQLGLRCNYMSSPELYLNAIQRRCSSVAIGCQSLEHFLAGDCFECNEDGHYCIEFGPNAWNSYRGLIENGVMTVPGQVRAFMITADHSPYCRSHFKVTLLVSNDVESRVLGPEIGTLAVELLGKHRERSGSMDLSQKPLHFEPGQNYSAVVAGTDVGIPKRVLLFWQYNENRRQSMKGWRVRKMPRIYVEYIVVQSLEHHSRQKFCPPNREPVTAVNEDYTRDRMNEFREEYCK
ncbi:AAEL011144-PA [Aedes aegypti]|uniref:AAEL011144-PA n=1 Tax=Aedes aegypti TaxID=7159 RepID=Q16QX3_AEDAE|nr:AAEL011144-PA [Aedes aegypti]